MCTERQQVCSARRARVTELPAAVALNGAVAALASTPTALVSKKVTLSAIGRNGHEKGYSNSILPKTKNFEGRTNVSECVIDHVATKKLRDFATT